MKLIERVYYSILGKPVKNILLFLVVTLLGSFLSASFSIYQANRNLENEVKEKLNPIILVDWASERYDVITDDNYMDLFDDEDERQSIIKKYQSDDRIKTMENRYSLYTPYLCFRMRDENNNYFKFFEDYPMKPTGIDNPSISDVSNGASTLIKGRVFTQSEIDNAEYKIFMVLFKSASPLRVNLFKNNNSFKLVIDKVMISEDAPYDKRQYEYYNYEIGEFEIIGISEEVEYSTYTKYHSYLNAEENHYIPSTLMDKISAELKEFYKLLGEKYQWIKNRTNFDDFGSKYVKETYIEVKNADDLDNLIKEIENESDYLIREVYSFSDSYNDVRVITNNLNMIAIISFVVCALASIILLSLIIQVFIHERRYEIGVFLSLGEKRSRIVSQIILEILLIGFLGISISLFTGNMIGRSLSNDLLDKQLVQYEKVKEEILNNADYELDQDVIIDAYRVEITSEYVISVYVGGMGVLLLSCLYPTNKILKMKPKKIMM